MNVYATKLMIEFPEFTKTFNWWIKKPFTIFPAEINKRFKDFKCGKSIDEDAKKQLSEKPKDLMKIVDELIPRVKRHKPENNQIYPMIPFPQIAAVFFLRISYLDCYKNY